MSVGPPVPRRSPKLRDNTEFVRYFGADKVKHAVGKEADARGTHIDKDTLGEASPAS